MKIARARIGTVNHANAVSHADGREIGTHHAFVIEEVGVDALADIGIAADPGRAEPFHQCDMVRPFNIVHREMRQVDDAAIFGEFEMLGVGDAPEMAVVLFVFTHGNAIAVFFQKMFIGGIAMGALPAAKLHEITAQFHFALIEG